VKKLKISGFTIASNAIRFDYPVVESIKSILPIVDEFIVNVGPGEDDTLSLIGSIEDPKVKIIRSQWNPNLVTGGYLFAQQTNIALFNCTGSWAFYLQADEVIHEDDLSLIMECVERYLEDDRVEGLTLWHLDFWGDYNTMLNVYPYRGQRRCRLVKPHRFVLSRGDAAGFTVHPKYKEKGRRIRVVDTGARLYHYSQIRTEKTLNEKWRSARKYHRERTIDNKSIDFYQYFPRQFMAPYKETHPKVMADRIKKHPVSLDLSSPWWRTTLTSGEKWLLLKTLFVNKVTDRLSGRGSYRLLKR
jgi:glycosyltransferase involved in cell wall biosynthesis